MLSAGMLYPHNGVGYDLPVLERLLGLKIPLERVLDTLVLSRLREPDRRGGHSLEAHGAAKNTPDFSRWSPEMSEYMRDDVRTTVRLAREVRAMCEEWGNPRAIGLEHEAARRIAQQMRFGFAFDVRAAQELQAVLAAEREAKRAEIYAITGRTWMKPGKWFTPKRDNKKLGYVKGEPVQKPAAEEEFNLGSEQQLARYFQERHGWKPKTWTESGLPQMGEDILREMPYPEAKLLADYARLDKMWGQIAAPKKKDGSGGGWLYHVHPDGRIRGYVNSNGAVTGRMTHSKPNTANADKEPRMRALWIAAPGRVLVGCDAEGLELRMLAHYLFHWDKGAYGKAVISGTKEDGTDPHSLTQKAVGLYSRDSAKTLIYALLYGGGDFKLGAIVKADYLSKHGVPMPGNQAKIGKAARAKLFKGLVGLGKLSDLVKSRAKTPGYVKGLDGRRIYIRSAHSALNTLLQGGGAIVMKEALVQACCAIEHIYGPHGDLWGLVANVHDEIQIECLPTIAEDIGQIVAKAITWAGESLKVNVPLAGKYAIGRNWSETH